MEKVKHYSTHLNLVGVGAIWIFLLLVSIGNSAWWACLVLAISAPIVVAWEGHLRDCKGMNV